MALKKSHGRSKAFGQTVSIEVTRASELPTPDKEAIDANVARMKTERGRPCQKGNKASGSKTTLAGLGVKIPTDDKELATILRNADAYRKTRVREVEALYGFVSVGAHSLIATAALALAASRLLYARGLKSMDHHVIKQASSLANDARQNELAAWEIASREGGAKARAAAAETPWLRVSDKDVAEAEAKAKADNAEADEFAAGVPWEEENERKETK